MFAAVLIDPKYPHNVGNALRGCAVFGAKQLAWTGTRVPSPSAWPAGARLPREERMKLYRQVDLHCEPDERKLVENVLASRDYTPVAVELRDAAESLETFVHPERAVYFFGPEDGSLPRHVLSACHRFVRIPSGQRGERTPLNLAAAVNIVFYDRTAKLLLDLGHERVQGQDARRRLPAHT